MYNNVVQQYYTKKRIRVRLPERFFVLNIKKKGFYPKNLTFKKSSFFTAPFLIGENDVKNY